MGPAEIASPSAARIVSLNVRSGGRPPTVTVMKMNDDAPTLAHPLGPRFEQALGYAISHHRDDRRKGTQIPYAAHLLSVSALVLEMELSLIHI